ncbi:MULTISPECIES: glucose 1-dehydrogenase [unclassified Lysobacter]|uniref:SDR family NAD(P)-dependent oxidoreductase n=1 Tax=unclassified Lysobacter TaxID=2635362 RepID=UPI0006FCA861|nr:MULTISPECIES: glucose 1-dehydrogenase [unclassified Lysobacter]KQZ56873.1 short-chain dehydrogenase [Lysobacter sp. Root559]KRA81807.1 short-chain dehydrogenase [Lysobacter sp. Root667]KRC34717.1 short-chain dehydrogenase [Lysobacter sp. Root76]KRD70405.1 short-chain dehydrogenase [Lysobacter sp. Root96]
MNRVQDKVCIVTGAALGIGRACAQRLAQEGARVALFDVLDAEGAALADDLRMQGFDAGYWHVDVSREAEVSRATEEVARTFGAVHVLVNNAGIAGSNKPTHELTEAEWDQVQAINVKGVFFCTKHAIPHMRRAGHGSIVNLSSIYGLVGAADVPPYHASKGAVRLMSKTDALIYAPDRIRVNSVHPGYIRTPMVEHHLRDNGAADLEAAMIEVGKLHPLGHMGEPDDIAWGVVYLASDEAKFMTGAELVVDGGYTAR